MPRIRIYLDVHMCLVRSHSLLCLNIQVAFRSQFTRKLPSERTKRIRKRESVCASVSNREEVIIDHISWKSISLVNAMTQLCPWREKHFGYGTWNLILIDLLTGNDNPKLVEINASECFHQYCQGRQNNRHRCSALAMEHND